MQGPKLTITSKAPNYTPIRINSANEEDNHIRLNIIFTYLSSIHTDITFHLYITLRGAAGTLNTPKINTIDNNSYNDTKEGSTI